MKKMRKRNEKKRERNARKKRFKYILAWCENVLGLDGRMSRVSRQIHFEMTISSRMISNNKKKCHLFYTINSVLRMSESKKKKEYVTNWFFVNELTASVDSESSLERFDKKLSSNSKSPLMFVDTFLYFG